MGLRARLSLALLLTFTLLGVMVNSVLQQRVRDDYQRIELDAATQAMTRLLRVLEAHFIALNQSTGEWSNYDDMHTAMQRKDKHFLGDLTIAHLKSSALSVLALRDRQGNFVRVIEAPLPAGGLPVTALTQHSGPRMRIFLDSFPLAAEPRCGLMPVKGAPILLMMCDHPIVRSDGSGTAAGRITIGRWLNDKVLTALAAETQLDFRFALPGEATPTSDLTAGQLLPAMSLLNTVRLPTLMINENRFEISFPLDSVIGAESAGSVTLIYPRTLLARANAEMWRTTALVALMILVTCAVMLFLIDRMVVTRLKRLQHEVGDATADPTWKARVGALGADEVGELATDVNLLLDVIKRQVEKLHALSRTDMLTGIANRRAFDERLQLAIQQRKRQRSHLSVVLIDVDHFKKYNDRYGHPAGDAALQAVAKALGSTITRGTDLAARVGGEEFALLLEDTDAPGALHCAGRLRAVLHDAALPHELNPGGLITVSAGIAQLQPDDDAAALYARADTALYRAKQAGRDRAVV